MNWPGLELTTVERLRILAGARPYLAYTEILIDASVDAVWSVAGDLEGGAPQFETALKRVEIVECLGDELQVEARGRFGPARTLRALLQPGYCLMTAGRMEIGLAAARHESDGRTCFAHFEGVRGSGRLLKPLFQMKIEREVRTLSRLSIAVSQIGE